MKGRERSPRRSVVGAAVVLALKAVWTALVVTTPVLGAWLASSLAAYANGPVWLAALVGLLLFPLLPAAWEAYSAHRRRARPAARARILTLGDRFVLRTLAINVCFLAALLAAYPQRSFVALATRGDWMLDGRSGGAAQAVRRVLFASAQKLEWLYLAVRPSAHGRYGRSTPPPPNDPTQLPLPPPRVAPNQGAGPVPPVGDSQGNGVPPRDRNAWPLPSAMHPLVAQVPPEAEASIEALGRYVAAHEPDPFQRVRALHDYVADRVAYDAPALRLPRIPMRDADAETVFRTHLGVCSGYAHLLAALGRAAGVEIAYVVGDARHSSASVEGESHAWNAARIEGRWYLIDATWDAGNVHGDTFEKRYSSAYLFTPPEVFGRDHFPEEPRWQLRVAPISRGEFFRQPMMEADFYAQGFELLSPDRSQVSTRGALQIEVRNPAGRYLRASVSGGPDCEVAGRDVLSVHCPLPQPGAFNITLFANATESGMYWSVGNIAVTNTP